jgi:hypothetical protein
MDRVPPFISCGRNHDQARAALEVDVSVEVIGSVVRIAVAAQAQIHHCRTVQLSRALEHVGDSILHPRLREVGSNGDDACSRRNATELFIVSGRDSGNVSAMARAID